MDGRGGVGEMGGMCVGVCVGGGEGGGGEGMVKVGWVRWPGGNGVGEMAW